MGFLEGKEARIWARRSQAERQEAVTGCFVRYFGPQAARPRQYVERDWMAEEFTRGCYGAHFAPGTWTSYGQAWRAPAGRIHWAGAECAPRWNGYMEGAVRSGEAAADTVAGGTATGDTATRGTAAGDTAAGDTAAAL
jgi:monoamine oxidase